MTKKIVPENAVLIPATAKQVFHGEVFDIYQWPQQLFDGSTTTFEMARRADTADALCIVDGKLLVLDDLQPNRAPRLTFPGGRQETFSEPALNTAKREALEETGYTFQNWRLIHISQPFGKLEWFYYLFLAWDGEQTANPTLDAGEKVTTKQLSFDEVRKLVLDDTNRLSYLRHIFKPAHTLQDIQALPEYVGRVVEVNS